MRRIFAVTAMIVCSQLHAQQDTSTLENVTVTANKYSTKTTETGKVVITITRQEIEKAGSRDLSQLITELGGVFINGYTSNGGKEKNIYLRGGKAEHTLITIDGVPVYDASGIGSNFDIRNIPIDNVERIEILKGSQSTLYGSDAVAGVINIITKKGGDKPFAINGTAHYGSFQTYRTNIGINGKTKAFDYNMGYTFFRTDGFSEAQQKPGSSEVHEADGYRQNAFQANLGIQASKNVRIQPFLRWSRNEGSLDNDAFLDDHDFTNVNKNLQLGVRNTITLGKGQINALYQLINTKRSYLDDSIYHNPPAYFKYNQSAFTAREHFADVFVVFPLNKVRVTVGSDFRGSHYDYEANQTTAPSPWSPSFTTKTVLSGDSVKQSQAGLYATLNYLSGNFNIEGGGRWNNHSEYGSNFAFNINPSYLINRQVKLFANVSSGYKTPSLYQLFSQYGNRELEPEVSLNIEGGVQYFTKDGKGNLRATYFNRKVKDAIAFFFNTTTFRSYYINQDEQNDHGFEIDGKLNLNDKIQLKALYSYVDGEITTKQGGKDTTYFNLLRRPKHTFNFLVGSQVTKAFYLSVQLNAVGSRQDVYFDPVTFQRSDLTLRPYTLLNLYAEYGLSKNRIKLFADLRNVTDEKYVDIYGYNTAGFNAYGGIRFRF
jgi:vitamin B12 transporter